MVTVKDVLEYIEAFAPAYMKEDWDRVGLNCGHLNKEVKSILVALDPFEAVCKEAKEIGADLLVTHHALLWTPGFITDADEQGRNALFLIENGIACINAHTNLDNAPFGINHCLADILRLSDITVINPKGTDPKGHPWGLLRSGFVPEQDLGTFLTHTKECLQCDGLRYVDAGKPVHRVAVGGGACAGEMHQAVAAGCDTFVTADVKYNQFWDAKALGLNLIDAGHFHTENPGITHLFNLLFYAFPDIEVNFSQVHTDCAKFFLQQS